MSGIVDIAQHLNKLKAGFTVHDLLIDMQNYFLEATPNGFRIMPSVSCIRDVEEILVNVGGRFSDFGLPVLSMEILPDEDIEIADLIPSTASMDSVSSSTLTRDEDGVERLLINFK